MYGGLHGGALASVAEMVAVDCARTVVGKEKELFLGELSNSYLSSAPRGVSLSDSSSQLLIVRLFLKVID